MQNQFFFKIAAPTITISALLLALGITAAWNVQRQQISSSELIQKEVHGIIAAQDLCDDMREIRHQLYKYLLNRNLDCLIEIARLHKAAEAHIAIARGLIRTPREDEAITRVETGWQQFSQAYNEFAAASPDSHSDMDTRIDQLLTDIGNVITPATDFLTVDRVIVDKTNEANRRTTAMMRQTYLVLGICGGLAGLAAGVVIARGINQSVVQLDVSIRGAVGRLEDAVGVSGPIKISQHGGFRKLEVDLQQIEDHIATVVERLRQRELEVLRSDQLAALGQLAAGVAHELRNPLMPMKMLVQAAVERDDGHGLCGQQLRVVDAEIRRLESSIQEFLDFARPPNLEKTRFDLRSAIHLTAELISGRAEHQRVEIEIVDEFPDETMTVDADAGQIRQVLLNLLLNGLDALVDGGRIRIRVLRSGPPGSPSIPGSSGVQDWVAVEIHDNGPGLPDEVLGRVFEPFVSTKETGTGLGLSICRRIVEAHGGMIRAENHADGGAVFTICLPRFADTSVRVEQLSGVGV